MCVRDDVGEDVTAMGGTPVAGILLVTELNSSSSPSVQTLWWR